MKKIILLLCSIMLSANVALADSCFIAKENGKVLRSEGDPEKRYAPMSTFKIALSLMGFDSSILIDEMHPVWPLNIIGPRAATPVKTLLVPGLRHLLGLN